MQADIFTKKVRERGAMASLEEATRSIAATFEAIAARLPQEEAKCLLAQLPSEFHAYFAGAKPMAQVDKLTLQQFYARIAAQIGCEPSRAERSAVAVSRTLQEAVSVGEMDAVRQMLPKEFAPLFSA
ncbi:MAG: DUF2267 domain-containing protein [Deltaproteobacteria bacterium]|nr:MAG: DUF2267 domain-containing protein [Deltaproteobacteria bacterium]